MAFISVFDVLGPNMIGPSSSHTAGAARLADVARRIAGAPVAQAHFTLYGSFAHTGKGHGTDKALVAGMLGLTPDDERLREAYDLAQAQGLAVSFTLSDEEVGHPNTVRIDVVCTDGSTCQVTGASVGGGNIEITAINGLDVLLTGEYPTIILEHWDRPGVVSDATRLLTDAAINIAFMRVFREQRGDRATMIIETDERVPPAVLDRLRHEVREVVKVTSVD